MQSASLLGSACGGRWSWVLVTPATFLSLTSAGNAGDVVSNELL